MATEPHGKNPGCVLFFVITTCVLALVGWIAEANVTEGAIFFVLWPVVVVPMLMLVIALVWSLIWCVYAWRPHRWRAGIPMLILAGTLLTMSAIPRGGVARFNSHRQDYETVVHEVRQGSLALGAVGRVDLPERLKDLSLGGEVEVQGTGDAQTIFFRTYHSPLDADAGFLFVADNHCPSGDYRAVRIMTPRWYYVLQGGRDEELPKSICSIKR